MWFILLTMFWLFGISIMDIRRYRVPVWMLIPGGVLAGGMFLYQQGTMGDLLKGMLPGRVFIAIALGTKKAGYGDGIVMVFLGILSGGTESLVILAVSLFLAAVFSLILLGLRKAGRNTRIPFLPFLSAAWAIVAVL